MSDDAAMGCILVLLIPALGIAIGIATGIKGCWQEQTRHWEESHQNAQRRARVEHEHRMRREEEAHRSRLQRDKESLEATNAFWHKVESQHIPQFLNLLGQFLVVAVIIVVIGCIALAAYWFFKKFIEGQKLKHDMEIHVSEMRHKALQKDKELEQTKALKERELQQQLAITEREMELEEKRLNQERYNDERKYRLELGRMYMEACRGAASSGQLHEMAGALTNMTQLMLLADQPSSSVESISQLAIMAEEQSARIQKSSKPRHRQRGRGSVSRRRGSASSHQSFDSSQPGEHTNKPYGPKPRQKWWKDASQP